MAKLHRFVSRSPGDWALKKVVGKKTYDDIHPIGTSMVQQANAADAAEKAAADAANQPTIPLPDEEELARIRRRRTRRGTGRESTILSDSDTFGPA